jgi:hypothetical protein
MTVRMVGSTLAIIGLRNGIPVRVAADRAAAH